LRGDAIGFWDRPTYWNQERGGYTELSLNGEVYWRFRQIRRYSCQ
jgi:hypothetical protein